MCTIRGNLTNTFSSQESGIRSQECVVYIKICRELVMHICFDSLTSVRFIALECVLS
jgi:hypothetical protein